MVRIYVEPAQQVKKKHTLTEMDLYKPFAEMTSDELKEKFEEITLTNVIHLPKNTIKQKRRRPKMVRLDDILKLSITDNRFQKMFFGDYAINGDESYEEIRTYALYGFVHRDNPRRRDPYFKDIIATIHVVAKGSPAYEAGLRENDHLVEFDKINIGNYTSIFQLRNIVRDAASRIINVQVRRGNENIWLVVSPRNWEKPGLIGCQILSRWGRASEPRWPLLE